MLTACRAAAWLVLLGPGMMGCTPPTLPQKTFLIMGTFFTITLPADKPDYLEPVGVLSANALYELESKLTFYRPDSDIGRLNLASGGEFIGIAPATAAVLTAARRYGDLSAGAFDVTVAPLLKPWGLRGGRTPEQPPAESDLAKIRAHVGYRHLEVTNQTARLARPEMQADLGGIAKGFAVDEVARVMQANGVSDVLLNLGGNIRALGMAAADKPWRMAVRNPFASDRILGWIELRDGEAAATSGNYERFVSIAGRRYAHIIDPRTGQALTGMAGVTVISSGADAAMDADALSTTLFVMGIEGGANFLRANFPGRAALFVPDRQPLEIHLTAEFAVRFTAALDYANSVKLIP